MPQLSKLLQQKICYSHYMENASHILAQDPTACLAYFTTKVFHLRVFFVLTTVKAFKSSPNNTYLTYIMWTYGLEDGRDNSSHHHPAFSLP